MQPPPSRVPKPTSRPATTITSPAGRHLRAAGSDSRASAEPIGASDEPGDEGEAPAPSPPCRLQAAAEDAADAGDASGQQHQQRGGKPDQRAADRGRNGVEDAIVMPAGPSRVGAEVPL